MAFVRVKECLSDPKQLIKLVVLVICICVSIYQLSGCVEKLLNPPIATYYDFQLNESIKYPSLTICKRPPFKTALFPAYGLSQSTSLRSDKAFEKFNFSKHNMVDFIETTTYNFIQTIGYYGYSGAGNQDNVEKSSICFTRKGCCHTIKPKHNSDTFSIAGGYFLYLLHNEPRESFDSYGRSTLGFEIYVHNDDDILLPEFTATDEENDSTMDYFYVEIYEDLFVTLTLHQYSKVSKSTEVCISEKGYSRAKCLEKCVHNQIASLAGCTLPWLRQLETEYEICSDYESVKYLISGFNVRNSTRFLKKCNCPVPCNTTIYITTVRTRKEADSTVTGSTLSIYFSSNLITTMTQVAGYDWNAFLADLGASLGFLLGLSVIGIIAVIEKQVLLFLKRKDKKKLSKEMTRDANNEIVTWKSDDSGEGKSLKSIIEFLSECDQYQEENDRQRNEEVQKY